MEKVNFDDFLPPADAQARFKKDLENGTIAEGSYWPPRFDGIWAIPRPDSDIKAIGEAEVPQIIFTTAKAVREHPEAFKDMDLVPAYRKDKDEQA